jgi:predicted alpha/beta-fold hydrolase
MRPLLGVPLRRERWETPDGDFLDLDFGPDPDQEAPLILLLHGLEGFSKRPYVLYALEVLTRAGMAGVGLNFRGCSGEPNRLPRLYHSGETEDSRFVLERLRERWPERPLGALGFSLGGNVLLKLMGERQDGGADLLDAAAVLSVPYDLAAGVTHLERSPLGRFYTRYFLSSLTRKVRAKEAMLAPLLNLDAVYASRSLRAFDEAATAPLHGFADAEDYYHRSSSNRFLPGLRLPTLLIHAEDDPFLPASAIPRDAMAANPHLLPAIQHTGGHVGFLSGTVPGRARFWAEAQVADFFLHTLP